MRRSRPPSRTDWDKSEIRRYHPDGDDLRQFELQNELRMWSLLWWEKQEQMNKIWWHRLHGGTKL